MVMALSIAQLQEVADAFHGGSLEALRTDLADKLSDPRLIGRQSMIWADYRVLDQHLQSRGARRVRRKSTRA